MTLARPDFSPSGPSRSSHPRRPTEGLAHPARTTGSGARGDLLGLLLAYVVCLVGIPSVLIFAPLGSAGTPAGVLADGLLIIATASRVLHGRSLSTPVSWTFLVFAAVMVASYTVGAGRPGLATEMSSADRGLLILAGWGGLVLVVGNGISTRERLDRLLRALTYAGGVLALVGLLQYFFGINIATFLRIPGLKANDAFGGLGVRNGFVRISGTARHPIEFGAVLTLVLPIGLHYSLHGRPGRSRRWAQVSVALMALAAPLTVARSAILGLAVGLGLLFWTWAPKQQLKALALVPLGLATIKVAAPQLLGTLTHLFTSAQNDPSVQNRVGDFITAGYYITQSPVLGRGFFTFIPEIYRTFDNQYLGTLVEAGGLGLLATLALFVGSGLTALDVRSHSSDRATRSLSFSLAVSMAVSLTTFAMFDAYSFPMVTGVFFLVVGAIGCLWRLERCTASSPAAHRGNTSLRSRTTALLITGLVLLAGIGAGYYEARKAPVYQAVAIAYLSPPASTSVNSYQHMLYLGDFPEVLRAALVGPDIRAELQSHGVTGYEVVRQGGSLAHGAEVVGSGDFLTIGSVAPTSERALSVCNAVLKEASTLLYSWQTKAGADPNAMIGIGASAPPSVGVVRGSNKRVELGLVIVAALMGPALYRGILRLVQRRASQCQRAGGPPN